MIHQNLHRPDQGCIHQSLLSYLISKRGKDSVDRGKVGRGGGLGLEGNLGLLLGVVSLLLDLSLSLELGDEVSVAPSDLLGQLAQDGEVAVSAESQTLEGGGNHHTLLLVVRLGDALEGLKKNERKISVNGAIAEEDQQRNENLQRDGQAPTDP